MSLELTEEEMRRALFGATAPKNTPVAVEFAAAPAPVPVVAPAKPAGGTTAKPKAKFLSLKLRVTLKVSKVFEGPAEFFVYDADTLSTFVAEQDAKKAAKQERFKYFELVSIKPMS